jgi:putative effector of murein hydrolase LrgA (UPF0299 family)
VVITIVDVVLPAIPEQIIGIYILFVGFAQRALGCKEIKPAQCV